MSRYIDADAICKELQGKNAMLDYAIYCINRQPTADVVPTSFHDKCMQIEIEKRRNMVEVVRCEDCKHGNYFIDAHTDNYGTSVKAKVYCRIWQDWVSANGYCFLADKRERREDDN